MEVRPLSDAEAEAVARWRYPGRYSTYNAGDSVTSQRGYWAVVHRDDLVGRCCFGPEARVPGVDEEEGTLDVGYGLRPDLVGRGLGPAFVTAILDFAVAEYSPQRLRLLILSWNERSRKVAEGLGFQNDGTVRSAEGDFLVMRRPPGRSAPGGRVA